jgi:hypothetical protein
VNDTKVKVGQVWESLDPRDMGRKVTVVSIGSECVIVQSSRRSRIRGDRFTGSYKLVKDVP